MSYDDWKLECPEDEQDRNEADARAFKRRLLGRGWRYDPDEARDEAQAERLASYYEDCKADWQLYGDEGDE